jgi:hypothetical protein
VADLILPNVYRAMLIRKSLTNIDRDDSVNTFAFKDEGNLGHDGVHAVVGPLLHAFEDAIKAYLAPQAVLQNTIEVNTYHQGDPTPREGRYSQFTVTRPTGSAGILPEEVAMCVSYFSGRNIPRHRGRIFLGPCHAQAMAAASGRVHMTQTTRNTLAAAASALRTTAENNGVPWGFISIADGVFRPITAGWVDDAFDTVRKRGTDPAVRNIWGEGT